MPFSNYKELMLAIEDWLVRPDLTEQVKDFVYLAEIRIQQDLNMQRDQAVATAALTIGQDWIALPADNLQLEHFGIPGTTPDRVFEVVSKDIFQHAAKNLVGTGRVQVGYTRGNRLYIAGTPTAADTYELVYQAGITHLSAALPTNTLLTNHPNLLLYGALAESMPYIGNDNRATGWLAAYADRMKQVKRLEFRNRTGGGPLRMRPDSITP